MRAEKTGAKYDIDAIRADLKSGMRQADVARKYGIAPGLVSYHKNQIGKSLEKEIKKHDTAKETKLESEQIRDLHRQGFGIEEIMLKFPTWDEHDIETLIG